MELLKKIQKNYGYDIPLFFILLIIFTFLAFNFLGHTSNPIVDVFQTGFYPPAEMLQGLVIYKDIFVGYGPLSYQINAILFWIFGVHLNTLYITGMINAFIIVFAIYLITRTISSRFVAFAVSFFIMATCAFHHYIFNYALPYSYAASYALSAFLFSVLFCIYYLKSSNPKFIPFSFLFISISILSKLDFLLFFFILIAVIFFKRIPIKYMIISLLTFLAIPLSSWTVLFFQGLTLSDLTNFLYYFNKFLNSPFLKDFYSNYTGLFFHTGYLKAYAIYFSIFSVFFLAFTIVIYQLLTSKNKFIKNVILINLIILLFIFLPKLALSNYFSAGIFCWITITSVLILLFTVINCFTRQKIEFKLSFLINTIKTTCLKDRIFILMILIGLMASARSFFFINLQMYGPFLIPLLLIVNVIFIIDYLPNYLKFLNKRAWEQTCSIFLIVFGLIMLTQTIYITKTHINVPVKTERGTIYTSKRLADPLNQTIEYINSNFSPEASFLMIPQGPVLNFMTNRPSNGWFYDLLPLFIEFYGEDKIIEELKKNPPDYILVNNRDSTDWGFQYFGKDYGFKIDRFILEDYKFEKVFGSKGFWIAIFKKKPKID